MQTLFAIGPQSLQAFQRQVEVVAHVRTAQQNLVAAIQNVLGNRRDVVATEVQRSQAIGSRHALRPFGQIVVAQIERLQSVEITDVKSIQFVVTQVQRLQPLQIAQPGVQALGIADTVR
ncbi:hypothetical protein D3C84_606220 [compost metagenome]